MVLNKLHHVRSLNFSERNSPCPFGEVLCDGQYESVSSGRRWVDGAYNIHSPHFKWPCGFGVSEKSHWLMLEICVDLTQVTPSCLTCGIIHHLELVVPQPSDSVAKLRP